MGSPQSKPEDRLRSISRDVSTLRSSLRQSRQNLTRTEKEAIVERLAAQSGEVSEMHGKVKQQKIDETRKNISATMEELLQIDLDMAAVESDSFIHVPGNQRRVSSVASLGSQRINKRPEQRVGNRSNAPTIREIEAKIEELRPQISTAMENRDSKQLRVHKTTIELIAGDLEMINVDIDTPLEKRKADIMKRLSHLYHKVHKVLKDLQREGNMQYQSNQSQKEKAINELAEIELHLAENESLLDRLTKEKDMSSMASVRNNIMQINQRLAKITLVDNEVKEKVRGLSQKLNEIIRNLDRTLARKEFDSKFAHLLDTYDRVIKNFSETSNVESTIKTLENLRDSVENLEELNDSTKNRKRDLLSKINKHLELFDDELRKESDRKLVQEIVEDNVILRKKVKSTDKEYTVIDQFINYWNNVKSNFDVNSYSNLSLLRIDSVLEEMQQSINDIRVGIANKCDTYPPTNLTKKQSHSIPKLNTKKDYGSHQSLNHLEDKIIKAKAKMYNISTPELLNVQEESHSNNRFSKIEEIKMQLREKLEEYLQVLAHYYKDSNQTVSINAIIVSNKITELLHVLVIAELKERCETLIKRAKNFSGTRFDKEFDDIKDNFIKLQVSVENFNIPDRYESLQREKDQLLDDIFYNIESLQEKSSFYRKHEDESVKKIKAKLQTLNDKVKRFSGTYKGVLYNQIERDLNKLLLQIGEQIEDKTCADETTKDAEKLLKILEHRASVAQSFRNGSKSELSKNDNQAGMTKIKNDLYNIKKEMDRTPDDNVDAFIGLQSRLDLVNLELSQISARSNENLEKEKDIFSNEAQTLRNVVDAKVALSQQPLVQWPEREIQQDSRNYPKNDVNKEMEKLESKFQKIKNEVSAPNAEEDIHKYYKLAQDIKKLAAKLEQYKFIKGTDLFARKTNLFNEMQYYLEALEKEARDANYVISIEDKLNTIENILDSNQQSDLKVMAKELEAIQAKLANHKVSPENETLRERKTSIQQKTDGLALKLKQMADSERQIKETQLREDSKKINEIENKVKALRPEIDNFVGIQSDRKFYELDETTMRLILMLDKFDTANSEIQKRKIKLIRELHQFGQILDERAQQTQQILDLEQNLEHISSLMNTFSGREEELMQIKHELEQVAKKAQTIRTSKELISRKNACMERLSVLFNKLRGLSVSTSSSNVKNDQEFQSSGQKQTQQILDLEQNLEHVSSLMNSFSGREEDLIQIKHELEKVAEKAQNIRTSKELISRKNACIERLNVLFNKLMGLSVSTSSSNVKNDQEFQSSGQKQTQQILDLEQNLEHVSSLMNTFSGREEDLIQIKHELEKVAEKAQNIRTSKELISRKNACIERLNVLFNKLMGLSVSTSSSNVKNHQEFQSSGQINTVQSSSSSTSSSRVNIVKHSTSGYSSKVYNFRESKDAINSNDPTLIQIEKNIKELELLLDSTTDEQRLQEIDDAFTQHTIELNNLHYQKDSPEAKMKGELYKMIENLAEVIDKRINEIQVVAKIEQEVDKIGNKFDTPLTYEQINQMDERLIQLQVSLGKMNNTSLKAQIDACMMKIILYAKNISDYKQSIKTISV